MIKEDTIKVRDFVPNNYARSIQCRALREKMDGEKVYQQFCWSSGSSAMSQSQTLSSCMLHTYLDLGH
jgi:hypothetical protein